MVELANGEQIYMKTETVVSFTVSQGRLSHSPKKDAHKQLDRMPATVSTRIPRANSTSCDHKQLWLGYRGSGMPVSAAPCTIMSAHLVAPAGCSFMDKASCSGGCCLRSTTSFHNSRSCFTRSSWDSMCCCEIWSNRKTLWSAFLAIMSRIFRNLCEQRWRQALSTRKDMFSAHSSQPKSSTSASLWSTPSASSNLGPGKTPTTWANLTTPFVRDATQCFKSSKGFSLTFVSSTS